MGTLYIVATPIGNLQDITVRAAKKLLDANVIACEDTRHTGILLEHLRQTYLNNPALAKKPRLISYHNDNEKEKTEELLMILKAGEDIVLVSDAGTPAISDPGYRVVKECREAGIMVVGLPGASSVILALSISGLPTDKFTFLGYLPKREINTGRLLENLKKSQELIKSTVIIFEAPHKLLETLKRVKEVFGDIEIVILRELTKIYEEYFKGNISALLEKYEKSEPKGEFVILWH